MFDVEDGDGNTPLHLAILNNNHNLVKLLLGFGVAGNKNNLEGDLA